MLYDVLSATCPVKLTSVFLSLCFFCSSAPPAMLAWLAGNADVMIRFHRAELTQWEEFAAKLARCVPATPTAATTSGQIAPRSVAKVAMTPMGPPPPRTPTSKAPVAVAAAAAPAAAIDDDKDLQHASMARPSGPAKRKPATSATFGDLSSNPLFGTPFLLHVLSQLLGGGLHHIVCNFCFLSV